MRGIVLRSVLPVREQGEMDEPGAPLNRYGKIIIVSSWINDRLAKSLSQTERWLSKTIDIQGVVVSQGFDYTYGMSNVCENATTLEIGLFATPSLIAGGGM